MERKFVLTLAIFLFGSFAHIRAQDLELAFYNKLSALIKEKEPDWELHRKAIIQNQLIVLWVNGQQRALISTAFLSSEEESQKHLRTRLREQEQLPESKFSKSELMGFGDQAYLLRYGGGDNRAMILFRKGDQFIEVVGPSEDVAKKFAQHVADLIPTKKRRIA
ncbi:MAG TPA: hypothetical protein VKG02_23015 [Blastocatellia bacterium]|nr:hypothetical protein [Blastocatellia bacterium]